MRPGSTRSGGPLAGKRIVVTRPRDQAAELHEKLTALGAVVLPLPAIEIKPPKSYKPLDAAISRLAEYDWIVFTSANGVKYFFERCEKCRDPKFRLRPGKLGRLKIAAIGPATAMALEERGVSPDFVPREYLSDEIARNMKRIAGKRILLPRADIAPGTLPLALREKGARVDVVAAYRTVRPSATNASGAKARAALTGADVIVFSSSSTVTNFLAAYPGWPETEGLASPHGEPAKDTAGTRVACIGPKTAATARENGLPVHILAREHTATGLVRAIVEYYQHSQKSPDVG